jgi:hypothetical protein
MTLCKIKKDALFLKSLISKISTIITNCGVTPPKPPPVAKTVGRALEYETVATQTDVITLSRDGFILYLYAKAYGDVYPEKDATQTQKARLADVYKALELPVPAYLKTI